MTTLRSFQDEIENIHARETAKQRAIANATAASSVASTSIRNDSHRRDHPDKENRRPPLPTADAATGPAIDGTELAKQQPPAEADFDPEDDRRLQVPPIAFDFHVHIHDFILGATLDGSQR